VNKIRFVFQLARARKRNRLYRGADCCVGRGFGRRADVRGVCCWWVWMVVRFVCVVREPCCARGCASAGPVCVPCLTRLPPVSFYRFTDGLPFHSQWSNSTPKTPIRSPAHRVVNSSCCTARGPLKGVPVPACPPSRVVRGEPETKGADPFTKHDPHPRPGAQEADDGVRASSGARERGCLEGILSRIIFTQN
jgi:hypothetical protein